jgi:RecB family exonuclease
MFGKMGDLTSNYYLDKPASEISPKLPAGTVKFREKWVKSVPISFTETSSQCLIKGRFDAIIAFEDGSYGIVDYKTSDASEEKAAFYSRQLSAYAYALENPAPGALSISPITRLGLFIITPDRYERLPNGEIAFVTKTTWMDIPRDDATFLELLREIVMLLDMPFPPDPAEDCGLCNYRKNYNEAGILE